MENNPYGLTKIAYNIALWLYNHDQDGIMDMVDSNTIQKDFPSEDQMDFMDAFEDLEGKGLIELSKDAEDSYSISPLPELPMALSSIESEELKNNCFLIAKEIERLRSGVLNNDLQQKTGLEIKRLNRAVLYLNSKGLVGLDQALATSPYGFLEIFSNSRTRAYVRENQP